MNAKPTPSLPTQAKAKVCPPFQPSHLVFPTFVRHTGEGYTVTTGKPVQWLTPLQLAAEMKVTNHTIRRWIREGFLEKKIELSDGSEKVLVEHAGKRGWTISADAIPHLRKKIAALRDATNQ